MMSRRPMRRRWLALGLWLLAPCALAALRFQVDQHSALSPDEQAASNALVDDVVARLPASWTHGLDAAITLRWVRSLPDQVRGRSTGLTIAMQRTLLDGLLAGDDRHNPKAWHAARATLIHELAHVYDRSPQGGLSRDRRLLDLAGWQQRPLHPFSRSPSAMRDRSPDRYELTNPREFVAVNFEHFLLDRDYACRRPQLYAYLAGKVGYAPPHPDCAKTLPFIEADDGGSNAKLLKLDPARVYAVDYLLAEGNDKPMSHWGHAMVRLVVCAPGRAPGPACRLDLQYHLVLSFRAFVGDVQISSWRGLTGSYPTRLYVLPLDQVIEEYARVELRGLRSVPLRLDRQQIDALVEHAAQMHWSYDGRYYFISNNCAAESGRLLQDSSPSLEHDRLIAVTPHGVLRRLRRAGLVDESVFADMKQARRQGYYFDPASAHYQTMLDVLRSRRHVAQKRVEDWLALSPDERRDEVGEGDLQTMAAALLLEQAALRRQQLAARDELKRRYLKDGRRLQGLDDELRELFAQQNRLARPSGLLPVGDGYGLPQGDELAGLAARSKAAGLSLAEGWANIRGQARASLSPALRRSLDDTDRNIAAFSARMRELARGQVPAMTHGSVQ